MGEVKSLGFCLTAAQSLILILFYDFFLLVLFRNLFPRLTIAVFPLKFITNVNPNIHIVFNRHSIVGVY